MAKGPKKKSFPKRRRHRKQPEPRAIKIEIQKPGKKKKDVELAIQKALDTEPTDLFRSSDTLIILIEEEGP